MILTCSNCNTQFSVPTGALGARGRKVKCSRCSHTWLQAPDPSEIPAVVEPPQEAAPVMEAPQPAPVQEQPKPKPAPAPAPVVVKQAPPALKIIAAFFALFAVLTGGLAATSSFGMTQLMEKVGLANNSQFAFENMGFSVQPRAQGKIEIAFKGAVRNDAAATRHSPVVTVILYDHLNRVMRSLPYEFPVATIEAGKSIPFEPKINNIPDSLARVVLELGNDLEQTLR